MAKKKFFIITTIPISLFFFRNQITFLKDEFEIHVVSSKGDLLNEISKLEQVPYHQVNMRRDISLFRDIISLFKLCYLFIKERPYIVHGNTPKAGLLSMLAAFITFVPKRIYYIHGLRYEGIFGFKKKLIIFMEKAACFFSTHIIAVSFGVKEKLIKEVTNKNVIVIGNGSVNGINTEFFCSEKVDSSNLKLQLEIKEADFVFGFIGRLVKDKGINELVQCFSTLSSEYKHCKLLLVGNYEDDLDPLENSSLEIIKTDKNIINVGFQSDIRPFLKIMDLLVLPSYREGFGVVLMEAAAMNVPAISSNISGCNEIIIDGENGYLIPAKDKGYLLVKMIHALNNRDEIKRFSFKTRYIIQQKFEQQRVWDNAKSVYKNIASS